MVGLPYPNPSDPELRERMAFMDRLPAAATAAATTDAALTLPAAAGQRGGAQPPAAAQQAVVASAKAGEGGREYYQVRLLPVGLPACWACFGQPPLLLCLPAVPAWAMCWRSCCPAAAAVGERAATGRELTRPEPPPQTPFTPHHRTCAPGRPTTLPLLSRRPTPTGPVHHVKAANHPRSNHCNL